jgi:mannose-6-phosphate isomerase-like protein (cupin superfamily)
MSSQKTITVEYLEKPWGFHAILIDVGHYRVKELIVKPGERLSYQIHRHRVERWMVLEGEGKLTLNGEVSRIAMGTDVTIPVNAAHRVENMGDVPLVILEAQFLVGENLSEEDIVRLADDYGRDEGDWEEDTVEYIVRSKEAPSSN